MELNSLLSLERSANNVPAESKKRAIKMLSELAASGCDELETSDIFEALLAREKLGPTAIGHGVALPHARSEKVATPIAAFIHTAQGIEFDASDHEPVDLIFGLLVPQEATDEHLHIIAFLAELFSHADNREALRNSKDTKELYQQIIKMADSITQWTASKA